MSGRILLVEDDADIRTVVHLALEYDEFTVDEAVNGAAAIAYLRHHRPDLVVLDIMLPEVDGLAVLGGLARQRVAIPVLVITAYPLAKAIALVTTQWPEARVRYLSKPFGLEDLHANVLLALRAPPERAEC